MAMAIPMPATPQRVSSVRSPHNIGGPGIMTSITEIVEEPNPYVADDTIYVAVAKDVKDSKSNLIWAIQNSGGRKICLLHVHVPAAMIPLMGAKFPESSLKEQEVLAYRVTERQSMHNTLDGYLGICQRMGVRAANLPIEMDCIEKGIVEAISQFNIRRLVMGAASDKYHHRRMTTLKSKKAIYVSEQAPASCNMQFVCKGCLVYTRNCNLDGGNVEVASPVVQQMLNTEAARSPYSRIQSMEQDQNHWVRPTNPVQDLFTRVRSANATHGRSIGSASQNRLGRDVSSDESDGMSRWSPSAFSTGSNGATVEPNLTGEGGENLLDLTLRDLSLNRTDLFHSSPPSVLDGGMDDTLYDQLQLAMAEAENARQNAYQETLKRGKAEKNAIEAIRRIRATETMYKGELKMRKELEEAVEKEKEELDIMKAQRDRDKEELQLAQEQNSSLRSQIASNELMIKELKHKITFAEEVLQKYKSERDDLQIQRDNTLREAEELRRKQGEASVTHVLEFSKFSYQEIMEATSNLDPSLKIGEGGYGSIFQGILRQTEVAIKILHGNSEQGTSEFKQEVEVLSRLKHPNLIRLVGACPESMTLVYEYLPNGSLEDRLTCKDNTPPLSWQTRIRIAAELCSALIFLHSRKPQSIVHGDLKPANILLDANLVSKLSDFGMCRLLSSSSSTNMTQYWRTDPKGTFVYMDPEFLTSCELTAKSDVYSFGIILLRLLTGRPAKGIIKEVQYALSAGKLQSVLDPLAGEWPLPFGLVQAQQLAHMAMRCCDMNRKSRPDLYPDVWKILEPMSPSTNSFGFGPRSQPPSYFICPIFQEVMCDPYVAADGFSYQAEAIKGWLDSGHDTSPVTTSKLAHHNLVPNRALRYAILDWLQTHSS